MCRLLKQLPEKLCFGLDVDSSICVLDAALLTSVSAAGHGLEWTPNPINLSFLSKQCQRLALLPWRLGPCRRQVCVFVLINCSLRVVLGLQPHELHRRQFSIQSRDTCHGAMCWDWVSRSKLTEFTARKLWMNSFFLSRPWTHFSMILLMTFSLLRHVQIISFFNFFKNNF